METLLVGDCHPQRGFQELSRDLTKGMAPTPKKAVPGRKKTKTWVFGPFLSLKKCLLAHPLPQGYLSMSKIQ
jgi:hypothetical protein